MWQLHRRLAFWDRKVGEGVLENPGLNHYRLIPHQKRVQKRVLTPNLLTFETVAAKLVG
jgi:hypothetical protein